MNRDEKGRFTKGNKIGPRFISGRKSGGDTLAVERQGMGNN